MVVDGTPRSARWSTLAAEGEAMAMASLAASAARGALPAAPTPSCRRSRVCAAGAASPPTLNPAVAIAQEGPSACTCRVWGWGVAGDVGDRVSRRHHVARGTLLAERGGERVVVARYPTRSTARAGWKTRCKRSGRVARRAAIDIRPVACAARAALVAPALGYRGRVRVWWQQQQQPEFGSTLRCATAPNSRTDFPNPAPNATHHSALACHCCRHHCCCRWLRGTTAGCAAAVPAWWPRQQPCCMIVFPTQRRSPATTTPPNHPPNQSTSQSGMIPGSAATTVLLVLLSPNAVPRPRGSLCARPRPPMPRRRA